MQTGRAPALLKVKFFILCEDYSTSDGRARGGGVDLMIDSINNFLFFVQQCSDHAQIAKKKKKEKKVRATTCCRDEFDFGVCVCVCVCMYKCV
jgi:hypothetical protein